MKKLLPNHQPNESVPILLLERIYESMIVHYLISMMELQYNTHKLSNYDGKRFPSLLTVKPLLIARVAFLHLSQTA